MLLLQSRRVASCDRMSLFCVASLQPDHLLLLDAFTLGVVFLSSTADNFMADIEFALSPTVSFRLQPDRILLLVAFSLVVVFLGSMVDTFNIESDHSHSSYAH